MSEDIKDELDAVLEDVQAFLDLLMQDAEDSELRERLRAVRQRLTAEWEQSATEPRP